MDPLLRILLVEDNPADARLIREALRDAGSTFELIHASKLADGIELAQTARFDVMLLDLSLPDGEGTELVARACAAVPELPVVVLTGLDDGRVALQAMGAGAQDYLVKGRTEGELLARSLRYAIERRRAEENARRLIREQAARNEAEASEARWRFLADATRNLSASLDYETTLQTVARLAAQAIADFCVVDLCSDTGFQRVAWAHRDPAREELLAETADYPPDPIDAHPAVRALAAGGPIFEELEDGWPVRLARCDRHRELLERLEPTALFSVPLLARDRRLGVITFVAGAEQLRRLEDRALAEELASRAALAVDNARLYALAQEAARRRDEVLGIVSHDLRNPLNVVMMMTGALLREPNLPAERRTRRLEAIERSAERMANLIQDLLDVTRIEGQGLSLVCQPLDVHGLMQEACSSLEPLASARSLVLELDTAPGCAPVHADRSRVLQIFSNLIGNAIKFTPEGGSVLVRAEAGEREVLFRVSDTGVGISEEELPQIFNRFWQSRRSGTAGAGLGLAIVKGIVEAHGGRITVQSRLGLGTTFTFSLPVRQE